MDPVEKRLQRDALGVRENGTVTGKTCIVISSAALQTLYWTIVMKRELSLRAKLVISWSMYFPTLPYGHKLLIMTERMRLWI